MAKLTRYTQKVFGSTSGANSMSRFGDLAASYPTVPALYSGFNITPALVQALSNYLTGWPGAVVGGNSPAIEDMNALCYLFGYQLTYLMQEGIPEYDSGTTYYIGSYVNVSGILYRSLIDNNTANTPASNPTDWEQVANGKAPTVQKFTTGSGTYTTPAGVKYLRVRCVGGGGGGSGSGTGSQTAGGTGGDTSFGTTFIVASGGVGGPTANSSGGAGGAASLGAAIGIAIAGGSGSGTQVQGAASFSLCGGSGAPSALGGGGGGSPNSAGKAAATNSGSGGGGGGALNSGESTGSGGGAGGFVDAFVYTPNATYAYSVGAAGTAGAASGGGGSSAGGVAGAGIIIVEEHYQ